MNVQSRLVAIFSDVFEVDPGEVGATTSPDNLPTWESIRHAHLVTAIEAEFGIAFKGTEILELKSFGAALDLVQKHLTAAAG